MRPEHVVVIVGTRPEAIKMAPVYLALRADPRVRVSLLTTAQHRQMLDQVLAVFSIRPDVDLDLMRPDQTLSEVTARVVMGVQEALAVMQPDAALVHGDTTTCLCSALAACYERIPVGHVEAGLRTYNFDAPWPEEINRRLTDPICRWCFAPTASAAENLRTEHIEDDRIFVTGNTVIDALFLARDMTRARPPRVADLPAGALEGRRLILVTGHRRESFGQPLRELCQALRDIVRAHEDTVLVYPVHLNPNVRRTVHEVLETEPRVHLTRPLAYLPFVHLMDRSVLIITDSGGIQEEAPSLGKPVLVTRAVTERPEAVQAGLAALCGTDRDKIFQTASTLLTDPDAYAAMSHGKNPYGDGQASRRIVDILCA